MVASVLGLHTVQVQAELWTPVYRGCRMTETRASRLHRETAAKIAAFPSSPDRSEGEPMANNQEQSGQSVATVFERDQDGVLHLVALSGGHDSTIMAFMLKEREPRPYNYVCTPTGNELPAMFEFWRWLGSDNALGRRLVPIMNGTLESVIADQKMIPNSRARFCTRILKIEPFRQVLKGQAALGPVVSYVGLRADEPGRAGGAYDDIEGVTMRFPLRVGHG